MIKLESFDIEDFALGEDGMIAVPLDIFAENGKTDAVVYRLCRELSEFHYDEILSGRSECFIKELCSKMAPYGYFPADDIGERIFTYRTASLLDKTKISTVILHTNEEIAAYGADTSLWNLELDDGDPLDAVSAVICDGVIIAAASVNDLDDDGLPEINVECSVAYRRRGYGTAVAVGLTNYLLVECGSNGVVYRCRERNTASRSLAEKAGFKLVGYEIPFVFYRNN